LFIVIYFFIIFLEKIFSFSEEEASQIISCLFNAVDYLHSREIVHRDIKPENILLADDKDFTSLKLIDFGLSSQYFEFIGDYEFCGTLIYMAPEQLEKRVYTKSIDIWSCGIIMYQLLNNGIHPFYNKGDSSLRFNEKLKSGKWISNNILSKYVLRFN
jgi:serine/threonine protein kinase